MSSVKSAVKNINITNYETSMKAFLIENAKRQEIFDGYYEELKETIRRSNKGIEVVEITPNDALFLLVHHIFLDPLLFAILDKHRTQSPLTALLKKTVQNLRNAAKTP